MFHLGSVQDVRRLKSTLLKRIKADQEELRVVDLTVPGGVLRDVDLHCLPIGREHPLGVFRWNPKGVRRSGFWLVLPSDRDQSMLGPAIEINFADDAGLRTGGRVLRDDTGRLYIAHKGGLGGGRRVMSREEFEGRVHGFEPTEFAIDGKRKDRAFILAAVDAPDLFRRLWSYAAECARLRQVASGPTLPPPDLSKFTPEIEDDVTIPPSPEREMTRLHARVVNALAHRLSGAVNSQRDGMRPDLYTLDDMGEMDTLFEVKSLPDSQSVFTALGQLVVYGSKQCNSPQRVLVCPKGLDLEFFQNAFQELDICVVEFTNGAEIKFEGLERVLEG